MKREPFHQIFKSHTIPPVKKQYKLYVCIQKPAPCWTGVQYFILSIEKLSEQKHLRKNLPHLKRKNLHNERNYKTSNRLFKSH